ncbi:flagellar attachment zone protein 1-like [Palaemon carinicauda]|uniref:flagellar attachment zone protein 1-like n=1 Tax=Palaemon carinicauda TaxID=392227 RepID=UPI0035B5757A
MFTQNAFKAISEYGKKYLLGGPSSEDGFQDQQPRLMEMEGLRLILGGGLLMRKFWAEQDKSEALEPVLDQEELDAVSEETEAVISGKDPLLSDQEEKLLLSGGTGSPVYNRDVQIQVDTELLISNRDMQVQVETGPVSNTDVTVQTDGHTEIEDLKQKNEDLAEELAIKQAVIQALVKEKEALKQELEDKVTWEEEYTMKIVQLTEALGKAKKEIQAHDEQKSILLAENEDLQTSIKERSFLYEELALEKTKLEKELMQARADDHKKSKGHQSLIEELQEEISKALLQNDELNEAVFTIKKKNEGLREQLEFAEEQNYVHNQMKSALVKEKEALKQELEDKITWEEENTMKIVQLTEALEKAKKEIQAHDEQKSILLAENEDLQTSIKERSFLYEELALEKTKLEKELMQARADDHKKSKGHQSLIEELQEEISKALLQNNELKEALFTITKKNEGLREQLENKNKREKNLNGKIVRMTNLEDQMKKELSGAKDVISSLKKELQKRELEHVKKEERMGDVETCGHAADAYDKVVVVKEEKQEGEGPTRILLVKKPKKKKLKRNQFSWAPLGSIGVPVLETAENKVHNEPTQEENILNN